MDINGIKPTTPATSKTGDGIHPSATGDGIHPE